MVIVIILLFQKPMEVGGILIGCLLILPFGKHVIHNRLLFKTTICTYPENIILCALLVVTNYPLHKERNSYMMMTKVSAKQNQSGSHLLVVELVIAVGMRKSAEVSTK